VARSYSPSTTSTQKPPLVFHNMALTFGTKAATPDRSKTDLINCASAICEHFRTVIIIFRCYRRHEQYQVSLTEARKIVLVLSGCPTKTLSRSQREAGSWVDRLRHPRWNNRLARFHSLFLMVLCSELRALSGVKVIARRYSVRHAFKLSSGAMLEVWDCGAIDLMTLAVRCAPI
jgi:hypothetical protein